MYICLYNSQEAGAPSERMSLLMDRLYKRTAAGSNSTAVVEVATDKKRL